MFSTPNQTNDFERRFFTTRPGVAIRPGDSMEKVQVLRRAMGECEEWGANQILSPDHALTTPKKTKDFTMRLGNGLEKKAVELLDQHPDLVAADFFAALQESKVRWEALIAQTMDAKTRDIVPFSAEQQASLAKGDRSMIRATNPFDNASTHAKAIALCERFGLASFQIAGDADMGFPARERAMENAEKAMAGACRRLGIAEHDFGGGTTGFCLDRQLGALAQAVARFRPMDDGPARIDWNDTAPGGVASLVHEFAHRMDNVLGLKALEVFHAHQQTALPAGARSAYFSELPAAQRAALPDAAAGLATVFGALGKEFGTVEDPLGVSKRMLAEAGKSFIATVMGPEKFAMAPQTRLKAWSAIIHGEDNAFFKGFMAKAGSTPSVEAGWHFFSDHKKATGEKHPLAAAIESIHKKGTVAPTPGFFKALENVWPALQRLQALTGPTPMLSDTVARSTDEPLKALARYVRPPEFLAALMSDPQGVKDFGRVFTERGDPVMIERSEANHVARGYAKLLEAAGIHAVQPPLLMGVDPKMLNPVLRPIAGPSAPASQLIALLSAPPVRPMVKAARPG